MLTDFGRRSMKKRGYLRYLERKQQISGKRIVGIDPSKEKHQAVMGFSADMFCANDLKLIYVFLYL